MSNFNTVTPTNESEGSDLYLLGRGTTSRTQTRDQLAAGIGSARWKNTNNYIAGDIVIAVDLKQYVAVVNSGTNTSVGAVDPTTGNKSVWSEVNTQFNEYNANRTYVAGDIVFTRDTITGEVSYWEWYSNVESLSGKTPLDANNRHEGWKDNSKPFYWIPYTGDQVGMPFYWVDTTPPEWAVMEINADLPIAVYWRLARRYPSLVTGDVINTGDIRGEFLRVLDQGRGVDSGRTIQSYQADEFKSHSHKFSAPISIAASIGSTGIIISATGDTNWNTTEVGGSETRPRNIARAMAITI